MLLLERAPRAERDERDDPPRERLLELERELCDLELLRLAIGSVLRDQPLRALALGLEESPSHGVAEKLVGVEALGSIPFRPWCSSSVGRTVFGLG